MRRGVCLLLLVGCRPPEAPSQLDDLCAWLYAHQADEDTEAAELGVANLALWLDGHLAETADGYTVHNLDQTTLDALDGRTRDASAIVGAAVGSVSPFPVEDLVGPLLVDDQAVVFPDLYTSFERTFEGDADCFVAGDCERIVFENEVVADIPLVGDLASASTGQDLWVAIDDGQALLHRSWMHEPVSASFLSMQAQYNLAVTIPRADGTAVRLQAVWADAEIVGADLPESTALNMLVRSLGNTDEALYEYVSGQR